MNQKQKFRQELKYLIDYREMSLIKQRLSVLMKSDEHAVNGQYKIRSLYFDDYWNSAYKEKISGVFNRRKYRIRMYDDSDSVIHLECKRKLGNSICKTAAPLTREETERIIGGRYGFLLKKENELCREFYYQCTSRVMRPCVIVDYEREPFVCKAGDVRITFDSNVRSSGMFTEFFNPELPCSYIFDEGKLVMEVKFTELLPRMIRDALPGKHEFVAVSKFVGCFEQSSRFLPLVYNGISDE